MSFEVPWTPSLLGEHLEPCAAIADSVNNDLRPDYQIPDQVGWTPKGLSFLDDRPVVKKALAECLLALWRLCRVAEQSGLEPSWVDHTVAWLVSHLVSRPFFVDLTNLDRSQTRHRDVIRLAGIEPLAVVMDQTEFLEVSGYLPTRRIPLRKSYKPKSRPPSPCVRTPAVTTTSSANVDEPMLDIQTTPLPKKSKLVPTTKEDTSIQKVVAPTKKTPTIPTKKTPVPKKKVPVVAKETPTPPPSEGSVMEIDESDPPPAKMDKGKKRARIARSVSSDDPAVLSPRRTTRTGKRRERNSFDGVVVPKRARKATEKVLAKEEESWRTIGGLDFSGRVIDEETEIDLSEVPKLKGRVSWSSFYRSICRPLCSFLVQKCARCAGAPSDRKCVPLWVLKERETRVFCSFCYIKRHLCSFKRANFGIDIMPTVVATSISSARRAEQAQKKQVGRSKAKAKMVKTKKTKARKTQRDDEEASTSGPEVDSFSTRTRSASEQTTQPGASSSRATLDSHDSSTLRTTDIGQVIFQSSYDSLEDTERVLQANLDSPVVLAILLRRLELSETHEQSSIRNLMGLLNSRSEIREHLISRIRSLDSQTIIPSEDEDAEEDDGEDSVEDEGEEVEE
jgi:hypothetical protein